MKLPVKLIMIALIGLSASDASAQDANMPLAVETASSARTQPQRTPVMIVHEAAIPAQVQPKADADAMKPEGKPSQKAAGKSANTASKSQGTTDQSTASGTEAATPAPPAPLVLPGAQAAAQPAALDFQSTGNPKYDEYIKQSAARNGVDPNLIVAVMRHESGYNSRARSYKGAMGLMQLMPGTALRFGVTNVYDPQQNIEGGTRYLRFLIDKFNGDVDLVLAGYNAGENAVINYGYNIPPYRETKHYVRAISARYDKKKTRAVTKTVAAITDPVAPAPTTFSGGVSNRLSNNY